MKNILTRVIYILLTVFCFQVLGADAVVMTAYAAPMTAQQKAKEKAKKEREREKAKQAKEKAKQAKEKEKAKQKAAAEKQKAAASGKKEQAKKAPAEPMVSNEEAYQDRVAEVEAYNKRVGAYNTRDIEHRVGVWGQFGYSALFTGGYMHNPGAGYMNEGFDAKAQGWVGGGGGLGYQMRYKQMLFTTGVEMEIYNSQQKIFDGENDYLTRSFGMKQYATMQYHYRLDEVREQAMAGYMQIPVLFGGEHLDGLLFWQAGLKAGLNVLGSSQLRSTLTTSITDTELSEELINMLTHDVVTGQAYTPNVQPAHFGFNLAAAAEIGIALDRWLQPKKDPKNRNKKETPAQQFAKKMRYRLSLFAEYGLLNTLDKKAIAADAQDLPVQMLTNPAKPLELPAIASVQTSAAQTAKVNPFLVGVKLALYFALPRQEKKMMPMPKEPLPRMVFYVTDSDKGDALSGVQLAISQGEGSKVVRKSTNRAGAVVAPMARGTYDVHAERAGYYAVDEKFTLSHDLKDTLRIKMRPEPVPVVYQLSGYVLDSESRQPVESQIRLSASGNIDKVLYEGGSSDDGLFMTKLGEGTYMAHVEATGYMPYDAEVVAKEAPVTIYMAKIREGVKVKINNLFFATNRTNILPESEQALNDLAQFLKDNDGVNILITGHTDAVGSDAANMRLSEGRANAVRSSLIQHGVDGARIVAEGKGETEPIATNDTEEGRAQNRRVEFVITGTNGQDIQQIR